MLLVQILGGTLGITIAWLIDRCFTNYENKQLEKQRIQHQLELENYKKSLLKTR